LTNHKLLWNTVTTVCSGYLLRDLLDIIVEYSFVPQSPRFEWKRLPFSEDDCQLRCHYKGLILYVFYRGHVFNNTWKWGTFDPGHSEHSETYLVDYKSVRRECLRFNSSYLAFPRAHTWRDACRFAEMTADFIITRINTWPIHDERNIGTLTYLSHVTPEKPPTEPLPFPDFQLDHHYYDHLYK
jgi:hypothetical protein